MISGAGAPDRLHDAVVIGGGITGAAAANQLTADGFAVMLVERGDFAGATTGRTSRLQYSGLSYFSGVKSAWSMIRRPGEVMQAAELARRAMRDRSAFIRATPERLCRQTHHFPLYDDGSIPVWQVRAGLRLLEALDRGGVPLETEIIEPAEARRDPMLCELRDPERLIAVLRFTEYQFNWPERICVDTVLHARDAGAAVLNHTEATRIARNADGSWNVELLDRRSGGRDTVRARSVVNAAGVWVDQLAGAASPGAPVLNQGAKGTNVMVRLPEAFRGHGFQTMTRQGAPFYVIPWDDLHYFGPRNMPHDGGPSGFLAAEDEIAELIAEMNTLFPRLRLRRRDVLYSWAGVRPRTAHPSHPAGGPAVRVHDLAGRGLAGYFAYTGGLLMTHRTAGRQIAGAVRRRVRPSRTATALATSARAFPDNTNAPAISPDYSRVSLSDLRFASEHEQPRTLEDLMFRRVRLGWSERMGCDVAADVAQAVRNEMGWSATQADEQALHYVEATRRNFGLAP